MPAELRRTRRVAFSETDMAGVMHFSNYYRWMEDVEHEFWRSLGESVVIRPEELAELAADPAHADAHLSWPRVKTGCEYFAPARFEDDVELSFRVLNVGDKSYTFEVEFFHAGRRIARGETTAVCCTMKGGTFRSMAIPARIREKLGDSSEFKIQGSK